MTTMNMHAAKTHLSRLVEQAAKGETIIIAKAGKPVARLVALEPATGDRGFGFVAGMFSVPDAFNTMFATELEAMFYGEECSSCAIRIGVAGLPLIHRDPFDRVLVALAAAEGILRLTNDAVVARYAGRMTRRSEFLPSLLARLPAGRRRR